MKASLELLASLIGGALGLGALVWWAVRCLRRAEDPVRLLVKWAVTIIAVAGVWWLAWHLQGGLGAVAVVLIGAVVGVLLSTLWAPHLGALLAKPFTALYDGGDVEPEPQPFYSVALAKRKSGKPLEAVYEIRRQIERFPEDVTGQMLLAEILAEDLNDLSGAQVVIERFIQQPGHQPSDVAAALNRLADWQWKLGQDPEAACATLERIRTLFPDTPMAAQAAQRIAHLSGSQPVLQAAADPRRIPVQPGVPNLGLLDNTAALRPAEPDPAKLAEEYVRHLQVHPADTETREKLAWIYAHHYRRLDLAQDQLEQLIQMPHQPPRLVARWLHLLADFQIAVGRDLQAATATLQRIIQMFPDTGLAAQAQQRLTTLSLELKGQEPAQRPVPLGTYEQNLGLKTAWRQVQRQAEQAAPPSQPSLTPAIEPVPGKPIKVKL
jgi:outer membrane protein assembly factor BamD (BamD/ComL family)